MGTKLPDGGEHNRYPAGQKERGKGESTIKAQVFREKEAPSKADKDLPVRGYDSQPKGY